MLDKKSIKKIIKEEKFEDFIGEEENVYFDAKKKPYNLDSDAGKAELAKDVTSFANAQGGFLIIGIKTEPLSKTELLDVVTEPNPIPKKIINKKQYDEVIKNWIYPNVDFKTYFIERAENKGFFVIEICDQDYENIPYLTVSNFKKGCLFGYAQRRDDDTSWADIKIYGVGKSKFGRKKGKGLRNSYN